MVDSRLNVLITAQDKASAVLRDVRGQLGGIEKAALGLRAGVGALAPAIAGAFTVAGIAAFVKSTVEGIDKLNDLADATGDSVENLSALEDVALRTGTSVDTAADAVIKLNKSLFEAQQDPNSVQARAIKGLGLDLKVLLALSPVERLQAVGKALNDFGGENKLQYNLVLLGKGVLELAPLLKDLAEAGRLNAKVTTEQAQATEALRKQWMGLEKDVLDLSRTLSTPMVDALTRVSAAFKESEKAGDNWYAKMVQGQKALLGLLKNASPIQKLQDDLREVDALLASPFTTTFGRVDALERRKQLLVEIAKLSKDAKSEFARGDKDTSPVLRALPTLDGGGQKKASATRPDLGASPISQAMTDALKAIEGTDVAKIAQINAALDELFTIRASGLGGDAAVDEAVKRLRDELEKLDPALRAAAESKAELDKLLAATPSGREAERLRQILLINQAFDAGKIGLGQWVELSDQLAEKLDDVGKSGKQAGEDLAALLGNAAGQALTDFQNLRSIVKGLLADILQIGVREASGAVSSFLTSQLAGLFGGPRAAGGPVDAARAYLVGERGPEIFMPGRSGTIVPNGAGAGMAFYNTFNVGDGVSLSQVAAAVQAGNRALEARILRSRQRNGAFAG